MSFLLRPICWLKGCRSDEAFLPELWRPRFRGKPVSWCLRCRRWLTP